jgi:nitrogen PTS system EIIA component
MLKIREDLMTLDDLAAYLKVSRRTIYEWLKSGKVPAVKMIGQWRFKKEKIDSWLEEKTTRCTSKS